jgi:hypothetical protein
MANPLFLAFAIVRSAFPHSGPVKPGGGGGAAKDNLAPKVGPAGFYRKVFLAPVSIEPNRFDFVPAAMLR